MTYPSGPRDDRAEWEADGLMLRRLGLILLLLALGVAGLVWVLTR